jgi:hypothetical protein
MTSSLPQEAGGPGGCGCPASFRWQCPECEAGGPFLACSRRCLEVHRARQHGQRKAEAPRVRAIDSTHRARLDVLLRAAPRRDGLCVLGAGSCEDLDLSALAEVFEEIHLVDLDGDSLARGLERASPSSRGRIVVHQGVDVSGVLGVLASEYGRCPPREAWEAIEARAAAALAGLVRRTFGVVLSNGTVTQLCVPYRWMLAAGPPGRASLMELMARVHLATMTALLRPGGTGLLVGDFPFAPAAREGEGHLPTPRWQDGARGRSERPRADELLLSKPDSLLGLLAEPALGVSVEAPTLTDPWFCPHAEGLSLAYGLTFRRRADGGALSNAGT